MEGKGVPVVYLTRKEMRPGSRGCAPRRSQHGAAPRARVSRELATIYNAPEPLPPLCSEQSQP